VTQLTYADALNAELRAPATNYGDDRKGGETMAAFVREKRWIAIVCALLVEVVS
jgi:hypothetical protein